MVAYAQSMSKASASHTPTRNAPEQEQHPDARHDTLPNNRARLMCARLVDSVQPRRAKRTGPNDAAREAVKGTRRRLAWAVCAGAGVGDRWRLR
jgi:hypothetical protein